MSNKISIDPRELEKLNIENLFSNQDGSKPHTDGKLDINTLFKNSKKEKDFTFDSHLLLSNVKKKKQKLKECYFEIYKNCCETILSADKSGITDIIYEIPHDIPECLDYQPADCLISLKNKLKKEDMSCLILNKFRLFISWKRLEYKIEDELSSEEHI